MAEHLHKKFREFILILMYHYIQIGNFRISLWDKICDFTLLEMVLT